MMNDDQTAWTYVRHESTLRDQPTSSPSTWWKTCEGQISRVSEAEVLNDPNVVHFLVYSRQDGKGKESSKEDNMTTIDEIADESQEGGSKPSKNIRLDSVLDWWEKTTLVVSVCLIFSTSTFLLLLFITFPGMHRSRQRNIWQGVGKSDERIPRGRTATDQ